MRTRRRVLVVGEPDDVESLFQEDGAGNFQFTYCAGDNRSGVIPDRVAPGFDWVVIKGEALAGDKTDLIQSLGAMGFLNNDTRKQSAPGCGVEWLRDGSLQLRCCMQSSQRTRNPVRDELPEQQDEGFIFEFHAPVKRTG